MYYNVYVRRSKAVEPLILWSPADANDCQVELQSPEELHKLHPQFAANSKYFAEYSGPLFENTKANDYRLMKDFAEPTMATEIPSEVTKLLGLKPDEHRQVGVGAYPPVADKSAD
jgi:hypothetical protein